MASDVGSKIAKRRQQLHLTQAELAARIGVNRTTVASWEIGKHFPQRHQGAVEHVLGVSLTGDEELEYNKDDPAERAIGEDPRLPLSRKRYLIGELRAARQEHAPRAHEPPA